MKIFKYIIFSILFYFVFMDESVNNFIIKTGSKVLQNESIFIYLFLFLQFIFSPLQAGFSDYFVRKNSLMISVFFTLISIILFKISMLASNLCFLYSALILKGIFGNTMPIAWAGIADISKRNNFRFMLALSICAMAVGSWGSLFLVLHTTFDVFYFIILKITVGALFLFLIFYLMNHFSDKKLEKKENYQYSSNLYLVIKKIILKIKKEFFLLFGFLKEPNKYKILLVFICTEFSFYQILFRIEAFDFNCLVALPLGIGIGYTLGTFLLKFLKIGDKRLVIYGIIIACIALFILTLFSLVNFYSFYVFLTLFALFSFSFALLTPSLFSIIYPIDHPHIAGKIYGLVDSSDSFASILTFMVVLNTKNIQCSSFYIVYLISLFMMLLSLFLILKIKNELNIMK